MVSDSGSSPGKQGEQKKFRAAGEFLKHHVDLALPGLTQERILDTMAPHCGAAGPPNKSTVSNWYSGKNAIKDDNLEALLAAIKDTAHVRGLEGGINALRVSLTFLYNEHNLAEWPVAVRRNDCPQLVKDRFAPELAGFAEDQSGFLQSIQFGDIISLGSVVLEGAAPIAPTLPELPQEKIIEDGEANLFFALSWNYRLTPFRGRSQSQAMILDWAQSEDPISVRLISGPGGAGKTRLAAEAVRDMRKLDWTAGFLPHDAEHALTFRNAGSRGLFLVIDYPEERRTIVDALIAILADHSDAPCPIRVLLLSRRGFDEWDGYATRLKSRFGQQELVRPDALTPETALQILTDAAMGLASVLDRDPPPLDGAEAWLTPTPDDPERRLPLFAAAAGLHAVLSPPTSYYR